MLFPRPRSLKLGPGVMPMAAYGPPDTVERCTLNRVAPATVETITGVPATDVEALARAYGQAKAPFIRLGQGLSRHASGEPGLDFFPSLQKISEVKRVAQGELAEALESYRAALAIKERLASADPGKVRGESMASRSNLPVLR